MAGRINLLNKKTIAAISDAISIGATKDMAAKYAHVSTSSLMHWLKRGRNEADRIENGGKPIRAEALYLQLLHAIEDAEGEAGIGWLDVVRKAATTDPVWAWKLLEKKFPDGFAPVTRQEITGADGGPVEYVIVGTRPDAEAQDQD